MNVGIEENYFIVYLEDFYVMSTIKWKFIIKNCQNSWSILNWMNPYIHKM